MGRTSKELNVLGILAALWNKQDAPEITAHRKKNLKHPVNEKVGPLAVNKKIEALKCGRLYGA